MKILKIMNIERNFTEIETNHIHQIISETVSNYSSLSSSSSSWSSSTRSESSESSEISESDVSNANEIIIEEYELIQINIKD